MFNNNSIGWKIFNLIVSIFFIIGGISGTMVLRGTNSSGALIVVGIIYLIWSLYSLITHKNADEQQRLQEEARIMPFEKMTDKILSEEIISLPEERQIKIEFIPKNPAIMERCYLFLNKESIGEVSTTDTQFILSVKQVKNVISVNDQDGRKTYFFFETTEVAGEEDGKITISQGGIISCEDPEKTGINIITSGVPQQIKPAPVVQPATGLMNMPMPVKRKKRSVALVLACIPFTGFYGIDRFYLGCMGTGLLKLLTMFVCAILTIAFVPLVFGIFIWYIIDIVRIATGKAKDKWGRPLLRKGETE